MQLHAKEVMLKNVTASIGYQQAAIHELWRFIVSATALETES